MQKYALNGTFHTFVAMNYEIKPAQIQVLEISAKNPRGLELKSVNGQTAILPDIFVSSEFKIGDEIEVFVYQDDNQYFATTERPNAVEGEFAVMTCVQTLPSGAFLDWGIIKDLFVPYRQQRQKMQEGERYLVYVYIDPETSLITGTAKYPKNIPLGDDIKPGDEVKILVASRSELGWNVIVNKKYPALVYANEVYKFLEPFSQHTAWVHQIREDGKMDIRLQPNGYESIDIFQEKILEVLSAQGGTLWLSDSSDPEDIKRELNMSKKNFKKAIGGLYKQGKINLSSNFIKLK